MEPVRLLPRFDSQTTRSENQSEIKVLERNYDRSGKKCWPIVNTNIGKFDLQYVYEVVGDTLESYVRCRKLNQCKALSNFIEYRNKVYKREKIGQYAPVEIKTPIKTIKIEEKQPIISPSNIIRSPRPETPQKPSPKISKPAYIPIPSPELLRSPVPKQNNVPIPKKTTIPPKNIKLKQSPPLKIKGQSSSKKSLPKKQKTCTIL